MNGNDLDARVRIQAFQYLKEQTALHGAVLPAGILQAGFEYDGRPVLFMGPQGIFKPAILPSVPLSFRTAPIVEGKERPYDDEILVNGLIHYRYRGDDPQHRDNVGLREAMRHHTPLIYLYGITPGRYMPVWPAYIVGDDPASLCFTVSLEESALLQEAAAPLADAVGETRRRYGTVLVQQRLHQASFRHRVLQAYQEHCAVCRLRHSELLDAAHILPDTHPHGEPWVSNGLALCKLHHGAFDANMLGVRPDLTIDIRKDIREETDGQMLVYGLQARHNQPLLVVPKPAHLRPKREFLEERYESFLRQAG